MTSFSSYKQSMLASIGEQANSWKPQFVMLSLQWCSKDDYIDSLLRC